MYIHLRQAWKVTKVITCNPAHFQVTACNSIIFQKKNVIVTVIVRGQILENYNYFLEAIFSWLHIFLNFSSARNIFIATRYFQTFVYFHSIEQILKECVQFGDLLKPYTRLPFLILPMKVTEM